MSSKAPNIRVLNLYGWAFGSSKARWGVDVVIAFASLFLVLIPILYGWDAEEAANRVSTAATELSQLPNGCEQTAKVGSGDRITFTVVCNKP